MNDKDFMRYSRQILLKDIGPMGQKKLLDSKVLIIGLGGLGSPAALYLAGAGIGTMILIDQDQVHLSNLHRQIIFTTDDITQSKAQVTKNRLQALNPEIQIIALQKRILGESLQYQIDAVDIVLDCSDNIETKQAINATCVAMNTPLITASAVGFKGQIMTLTPPWLYGCYKCLWSDSTEVHQNCHATGVIGPVVGIMGVLQALEVIMLLSKINTKRNCLRLFDAQHGKWHELTLQRVADCSVCGG